MNNGFKINIFFQKEGEEIENILTGYLRRILNKRI